MFVIIIVKTDPAVYINKNYLGIILKHINLQLPAFCCKVNKIQELAQRFIKISCNIQYIIDEIISSVLPHLPHSNLFFTCKLTV